MEEELVFDPSEIEEDGMMKMDEEEEVLIDPLTGEQLVQLDFDPLSLQQVILSDSQEIFIYNIILLMVLLRLVGGGRP